MADRQTRRLTAVTAWLETLTAERDSLILELRDRGMSLRAIVSLAGLTHVGVLPRDRARPRTARLVTVIGEAGAVGAVIVLVAVLYVLLDKEARRRRRVYRSYRRRVRALERIQ